MTALDRWARVRVDSLVALRKQQETTADAGEIFLYSIPAVQALGSGEVVDAGTVASDKLRITEPVVLVSKLNPRKNTICEAEPTGLPTYCSTEFLPLVARSGCERRFLYWMFQSEETRSLLSSVVRSVTKSHQRVEPSDLLKLWVLVPVQALQRRIADFLDRKTVAIDALIAKKETLVALLAEKRQALITQAVTKGLDPAAPTKDSGLEWLGPIPATWKVAKIGQLARVRNGSTPSRAEFDYWDDGTIPWLSSGKVNDYVVTEADQFITEKALRECSVDLMPAGAVIVGMIGEGKTRGTSAIMKIPACINQNMAAIVAGPRLRPWFVLHVLTAAYLPLREFGRGGQQDALNCQILSSFRIPLPPLEQQDAIIGWIDAQTAKADRARAELTRSIDKLREYRQALITAAVTGKLDVSGEAAA